MTIPIQISEHVSTGLSALINEVLGDEQLAQPATLSEVRERIMAPIKTATVPLNRFSSDETEQLREEVDALIDEFGEDALAVRFQRPWASEALSRLMTAAMEDTDTLTLDGLLEGAQRGLLAHLIGNGEIDDDEAQTLISELQALIGHHGPDTLVEELIHEP